LHIKNVYAEITTGNTYIGRPKTCSDINKFKQTVNDERSFMQIK